MPEVPVIDYFEWVVHEGIKSFAEDHCTLKGTHSHSQQPRQNSLSCNCPVSQLPSVSSPRHGPKPERWPSTLSRRCMAGQKSIGGEVLQVSKHNANSGFHSPGIDTQNSGSRSSFPEKSITTSRLGFMTTSSRVSKRQKPYFHRDYRLPAHSSAPSEARRCSLQLVT